MSLLSSITLSSTSAEEARNLTLRSLDELLPAERAAKVGVRLWDGTLWPDDTPRPTTVVLKHPGALRAMFLAGNEVGLGEAYLCDAFDIEGEVEDVFSLAEALGARSWGWLQRARAVTDLLHLPRREENGNAPYPAPRRAARLHGKRHSIERDRQAIAYHYNASNDFYALWLDSRMVYSCAYFASPGDALDVAQERKLDYICRKLRLRPGQKLLDVGCGWGGLIMHAARHYGVDATGITLSEAQAKLATERITAQNLEERCRVLLCDYRELDDTAYDALVSVGMFEHVGAEMLPKYFRLAWEKLRPRGVFLNHGIACNATVQLTPGPSFIDSYIFPDGELVPINVTLRHAEENGFEVRDVESLREHYTLTLRHWVSRLEARHEHALRCVDEATYRSWRLYMAGSAHGFNIGRLNLYQTLLVKTDTNGQSGLPLTRADWYGAQDGER